jgi:hypothetical protein
LFQDAAVDEGELNLSMAPLAKREKIIRLFITTVPPGNDMMNTQ